MSRTPTSALTPPPSLPSSASNSSEKIDFSMVSMAPLNKNEVIAIHLKQTARINQLELITARHANAQRARDDAKRILLKRQEIEVVFEIKQIEINRRTRDQEMSALAQRYVAEAYSDDNEDSEERQRSREDEKNVLLQEHEFRASLEKQLFGHTQTVRQQRMTDLVHNHESQIASENSERKEFEKSAVIECDYDLRNVELRMPLEVLLVYNNSELYRMRCLQPHIRANKERALENVIDGCLVKIDNDEDDIIAEKDNMIGTELAEEFKAVRVKAEKDLLLRKEKRWTRYQDSSAQYDASFVVGTDSDSED